MAGLFIALFVDKCTACQSHWKSDFGWHRFQKWAYSLALAWGIRGLKSLKRFWNTWWPSEAASRLVSLSNYCLWCVFLPRVHLEKEQTLAYAYLTHDFQRHFTLNTSLREWKLLSLYMFHRIIFISLIVSSPSSNFYRCTGCFQSNINIACRNNKNAACKYHSLLKITHDKTIHSLINKGK